MVTGSRSRRGQVRRRLAFTLIELLVVVAIIGLLVSILLPSLRAARAQAKAAVCGSNMRSVGQAIAGYLAESKAVFPASYEYLDLKGQIDRATNVARGGYLHWSYSLWAGNQAGEDAFKCPEIPNGGLPRTNPGPEPKHWDDVPQKNTDDFGNTDPDSSLTDKQAPRMAYTANAAVMPRNKFNGFLSGNPAKVNRFVRETEIKYASEVIMVTEFGQQWTVAGDNPNGGGAGPTCKSHRPINVFYSQGGAYNEYNSTDGGLRYTQSVPTASSRPDRLYGIYPEAQLEEAITGGQGLLQNENESEVNALGRHHPGGNYSRYGGTTNFLFVDGHVERNTLIWSMDNRKWGDRYYALSGDNRVVDFADNRPVSPNEVTR